MTDYLIEARVAEPICIADHRGAGNEYLTRDYVPGTAWWGAFAAATGIAPGEHPVDWFRHVFHSGDVHFTNLYPQSALGTRAGPVPLSARTRKAAPGFPPWGREEGIRLTVAGSELEWPLKGQDEPGRVVDLLCSEEVPRFEPDWTPASGWFAGDPPSCFAVGLKRVFSGGNEILPTSGTTVEGRLFMRQDIQRGERLVGGLRVLTDAAAAHVQQLFERLLEVGFLRDEGRGRLSCTASIGRQPGYVDIELIPFNDWTWQPEPDGEGCELTVTLLSDALVPDRWLRPLRFLPADVVQQALTEGNEPPVRVEGPLTYYSRLRRITGWNGAYRRPREPEFGLAVGSAFRYRIAWSGETPAEERNARLARFQRRGLGLRRAEGFGEVQVNAPFHARYSWRPVP